MGSILLSNFVATIGGGLATGILLSTTIWLPPRGSASKEGNYSRILIIICTALFSAAIFILGVLKLRLSGTSTNTIFGAALLALVLRLVRLSTMKVLPRKRLILFTIFDFVICGAAFAILVTWSKAMLGGNIICVENIFGFPALYIMCTTYFIYNYSVIFPERLRLATWRLLSYAFPEGREHNKGSLGRSEQSGLRVYDLIVWGLVLLSILAGHLFGYWLAGCQLGTTVYYCAILTITAMLTLKGAWRSNGKGRRGQFNAIFLGSGMVVAFSFLILFISYKKIPDSPGQVDRLILAIGIASPIMLTSVVGIPSILDSLKGFLIQFLRKSSTYLAIQAIAHAAFITAFNQKATRVMQAIVVSGVFLAYLMLPRMEPLFQAIGLSEVRGIPIRDVLEKFEEIALTWTLSNTGSSESVIHFVLGNQGLVLMFLLWIMASLMGWGDVASRLTSVPNLCRSKLSKFIADFHIVLFDMYFLPFFLFISLMIPLIGSNVIGYQLAILLGVFTFGLTIPRLVSCFLALGYLAVAAINTEQIRDALDLNTASMHDLMLLPGIGSRLANRIVVARPIQRIDDLRLIDGFGSKTMSIVSGLIRI